MKKLISILLTFALFVGVMPAYAGEADAERKNLLTDGGFEAVESLNESWKFPNSGAWYRGGDASVDKNTVHNGGSTKSVTSTDAIVGQTVALEKDKTYRFEIWINVTKAAYIDAGFFTASSAGAITIVKTPDNKKIRERERMGKGYC